VSTTPRRLVEWSALMGIILAALLLTERYLVSTRTVAGPSMEPTLMSGDRVLVDRWTFKHRRPRAGEIVVALDEAGRPLVKRVAASPRGVEPDPGADAVWLLGDNAPASMDSRRIGAVPVGRLAGRVFWRYWPLSRAGGFAETLPER